MRLSVAVVMASVSRSAGGILESAQKLARSVSASEAADASIIVFGLKDRFTDLDRPTWGSIAPRVFRPSGPLGFGYAPRLGSGLLAADATIAHLHGLWMYTSIAAARWTRSTGRPLVTSPHGMLDAWALANSGWKKRLATLLYERRCLSAAACIHALSGAEADSIRAFGLKQPVCVIPNGVDPIAAPDIPPPWIGRIPARAKVLLYLGRIHAKKGLDLLLDGWGRASNDLAKGNWHLAIAGWGQDAYLSELVHAARYLRNRDSVHFLPPLYGADKAAALTQADAFVLASRSEGLPMAALEAWAAARPLLMTPQCNLPEGLAAGAAVAIEPHATSVAAGLRQLCAMGDQQRNEMGRRGLQLVERRFTWSQSAASLVGVYRWLLGDGPAPACVIPREAPTRTSMPSVTKR